MIRRYAELLPDELARAFATRPVAYVPWGALEWHGAHLPLGLDGLVAEGFAARLADQQGGVLLPTYWLPVTPLPHPASLGIASETVAAVLVQTLLGLYGAGCRVACVISGHYAQGHELIFVEAAEAAMAAHTDFTVLCGTPLALLEDPALLDHAGRWETAQLLALRPELVHLERLATEAPRHPHADAVLGPSPREASAAEGEDVLERAAGVWREWIEKLLGGDRMEGRAKLAALYDRRRADYRSYVERFYTGSWEEAAERWWRSLA